MQDLLEFALNALRMAITAVTLSNEAVLLTSSWIVSPSPTSPSADAIPLPPPAWTAIVYATAEPLLLWLFQQTRIAPWIFLINTPHHLWVCEIAAAYLCQLLLCQTRSPEDSISISDQWEARSPLPRDTQHNKAWQVCLAALWPVLSAAASNAALLLFTCSLDDCAEEESAGLLLLFGWLGFVLYLGSRHGDLRIGKMAQRWPLWNHDARTRVNGYLLCIGMLFAIKATTRTLLGMNAFPLASGLEPSTLGKDVPCWVSWTNACTPAWVRLAIIVAPLPLSYIATVLLRYVMKGGEHHGNNDAWPKNE